MKSLPILTAVLLGAATLLAAPVLAQVAPEKPQPDDPRAVLERARENLISLKSLKANVRETVSLGNRRFKAEGAYLQGTDLKLRLEFTVRSGGIEGSLLEVCDGTILWTRKRIGDQTTLTRRDVRQILNAAAGGGNIAENILVAELGLGGLPALLASLERSMTFDRIERQEIDGTGFVIVEGGWNDQYRQRFQANSGAAGQLPDLVPDRVRIYFDAETLIPRRVQYLKARTETSLERPLVTLDFTDVVIDAPVSDSDFEFVPPEGVYAEDVTNKFIQKLTQPAPASTPPATPQPSK